MVEVGAAVAVEVRGRPGQVVPRAAGETRGHRSEAAGALVVEENRTIGPADQQIDVLIRVEVLDEAPEEPPLLRQPRFLRRIAEAAVLDRQAVVAPESRPEHSDEQEIDVAVVVEVHRLHVRGRRRYGGERERCGRPGAAAFLCDEDGDPHGRGQHEVERAVVVDVQRSDVVDASFVEHFLLVGVARAVSGAGDGKTLRPPGDQVGRVHFAATALCLVEMPPIVDQGQRAKVRVPGQHCWAALGLDGGRRWLGQVPPRRDPGGGVRRSSRARSGPRSAR